MPATPIDLAPRTTPISRLERVVGGALVALLGAFGASALLGPAIGVAWLAAPLPGWPPMTPSEGVCTLALSVGLWGRPRRFQRVTSAGAGIALAVGLWSLFEAGLRQHASWAGMSPPSAVLIVIAAAGLMGGAVRGRPDVARLTFGLAGLALVALTGTIAFARVVGVFGLGQSGQVPGSSAQLIASMMLLGVAYLVLVQRSGFGGLEPPQWLPAVAGITGLAIVLLLWQALVAREYTQDRDRTRQALVAEERLLRREVAAAASPFRRVAGLAATGLSVREQLAWLEALRNDIPSMRAAFRLQEDGQPLLMVPPGTDAAQVTRLWQTLLEQRVLRSDTTTYLPLDSTATQFVIFAPVCTSRCDGAIVGVIDAAVLFGATLADTLRPVAFGLSGSKGGWVQPAPKTISPSGTTQVNLVQIGDIKWWLAAWPAVNDATPVSSLPGTVLFMGLVVSLLLPITLQLGRSAWEGARDRERSRIAFALDSTTDGLWEVRLESGRAVRQPALRHYLQYAPDAVVDDDGWLSLVHPDDRPRVEAELARHLTAETETFEAEYRVRAGDGSWHTVADRGRIVDRSPGGDPTRILGIRADVTQSRRVAAARDQSERRFRALFNSGFQFQLLLNPDCRVVEANQTALEHAGVTLDEVHGQECWNTLWWSDNAAAQTILREACASANSGQVEVWEQEISRGDRGRMMLELSLKPIVNEDGGSHQLLLEGRDITERRRAEASLKELDTLTTMGRVAARVAHEINNPLAGIQNAFLLIKDAVPPTHPHFAFVGSIEREIERIARVTRQLYETYRPEQDTSGVASIQLVVHDAVAFLQQVNRARDVRVECILQDLPSAVPVPAAILRQIIYNLVQNAIDASPVAGVVTVTASVTEQELSIRVRDQGPGVSAEVRDRIFEPFFTTKDKDTMTSGMGLGLALVQRTITAAGGTIEVNSQPGEGAEFLVRLPLDGMVQGGTT